MAYSSFYDSSSQIFDMLDHNIEQTRKRRTEANHFSVHHVAIEYPLQ